MSSRSAGNERIRVAIVEDDSEIRADLASRIGSDPAFTLVGAYPSAESALAGLVSQRANIVLMDINLPGMDGVDCVRLLKTRMPDTQFVMLTVYEEGERLFKSLMAGASGYLLKRTSPDKLLAALHEAHSGSIPMSPEMARQMLRYFRQKPEPSSALQTLTSRERDVLDQLSKGFRYKEIEDNLHIGVGTLRGYIKNLYAKLHVHSRTEAVVEYLNR